MFINTFANKLYLLPLPRMRFFSLSNVLMDLSTSKTLLIIHYADDHDDHNALTDDHHHVASLASHLPERLF